MGALWVYVKAFVPPSPTIFRPAHIPLVAEPSPPPPIVSTNTYATPQPFFPYLFHARQSNLYSSTPPPHLTPSTKSFSLSAFLVNLQLIPMELIYSSHYNWLHLALLFSIWCNGTIGELEICFHFFYKGNCLKLQKCNGTSGKCENLTCVTGIRRSITGAFTPNVYLILNHVFSLCFALPMDFGYTPPTQHWLCPSYVFRPNISMWSGPIVAMFLPTYVRWVQSHRGPTKRNHCQFEPILLAESERQSSARRFGSIKGRQCGRGAIVYNSTGQLSKWQICFGKEENW